MRILFDQGTPAPLRTHLSAHDVTTAWELQWGTLTNGELLQQAEASGFGILITTDQSLKYQQNLAARRISIIVICTTSWVRIEKNVGAILGALDRVAPGSYEEVHIP